MSRKPRNITNPAIRHDTPAWRVIIEGFGGLANFCELTGVASSTAYDWLTKGLIPAHRQADIMRDAADNRIGLPVGIFEPRPARG